jgi:hypothetical protein
MEPLSANQEAISAPVELETAVEIIEVAGEWHVRVVSPDGEIIKTFGFESRAIDFAAEQCLRLNLERYERL